LNEFFLSNGSRVFIDNSSLVGLGVLSYLPVILVNNLNVIERFGWLCRYGVTNAIETPLVRASRSAELGEFNFHDAATDGALNAFKSNNIFAVEFLIAWRANFLRKRVLKLVSSLQGNLRLHGEGVRVLATVHLV
jgi:hypothetical protein